MKPQAQLAAAVTLARLIECTGEPSTTLVSSVRELPGAVLNLPGQLISNAGIAAAEDSVLVSR